MAHGLGDNEWMLRKRVSVVLEDVEVEGEEYELLTRFPEQPSEANTIVVVRAEGTGAQVRASSPTDELDFKADLMGPQVTATIVADPRLLNIEAKAIGSIPGHLVSLEAFAFKADSGFVSYLASEGLPYDSSYPPT